MKTVALSPFDPPVVFRNRCCWLTDAEGSFSYTAVVTIRSQQHKTTGIFIKRNLMI